MTGRVRIAVTMGDPAGVGPEVVLRALASASVRRGARVAVVGDAAWLQRVARRSRLPWPPPYDVWDVARVPRGVVPGRASRAAGRAALEALDGAIALALAGAVAAIVTAPVSKAAINRVRRGWRGHTEYLAAACGVAHPVMLFVAGRLAVGLVTTHHAVAEAIRRVTPARVTHAIVRTVEALQRDCGIRRPRVGIAAINPHAGEGGLFGFQERRWLTPLIRRLQRRLPARLSGPWPADAVFAQHARGAYDAVVAMYHDQALIPVKLLAWERAVNVTLGLPFIRTSPSHGTAFDLVGTGRADPCPMRHAIRLAIAMARQRKSTRW